MKKTAKKKSTTRKLSGVNHHTMPLRRIVRREVQNGRSFVVLVCGHASPGVPASRLSRFYPCPVCALRVAEVRAEYAAGHRRR